ncbi:MAG: MBL fold metallo-hydrolase [Sulfolobales archaeon]|nr:MBL fold metallo-hydrolase [Sulfolobales archaeon]MDW8083287.1 MBL fold metallo-hydrolase [Sulfolobales archaeon]
MKIVLLGFGGWISNPLYGQTSLLVLNDNSGEYILLDAGEGVLRNMFECGFSEIRKLKAVVITHSHGDHVLGIPTLVQFAKTVKSKIVIVGLRETIDAVVQILKAVSVSNYECCIEPVAVSPGDVLEVGGFRVRFAEVEHTIPGLAVRVEDSGSGRCLVYTGDTSYSEQIVRLSRDCSVLLHEASFLESESTLAKSLGHSTLSDCLRTAVEARNRFVIPLHFGLAEVKIDIDSLPQDITILYPSKCLSIDI